MSKKRKWARVLFAISLVICGMGSIALTLLDFIHSKPLIYNTSTIVLRSPEPHHTIRVKQGEWPLHLCQQLEIGESQQRYIVTMSRIRERRWINMSVTAASPERAEVFADWLAKNFHSDLNESYKSRDLPSIDAAKIYKEAKVLERSPGWIFISFGVVTFLPTLLIISGIVLLLTRE